MKIRREVLGDEHVDRAIERTTPFTADFQDLITRYAWGEIWSRPGLDRRTRSAITLTALIALGRDEELAMHVRAALRNGLTEDEIKEVLLQSAIYCGVPAANRRFAIAQRVLTRADAHAGRHRRGGPRGPHAWPPARAGGIEAVVLENRSRDYVEHRIRAGVIEQGVADLLVAAGVGGRLQREGIVHHGIELQFDGERHRIPLSDLAGGRSIVIYGQTEVVKDLIAARLETDAPLYFEVDEVSVEPRSARGSRFTHEGARHELDAT